MFISDQLAAAYEQQAAEQQAAEQQAAEQQQQAACWHPLTSMSIQIHCGNVDAGWYDKPRETGTLLMLMVSELAEAMEADRKNLMDDHLPHRSGCEVELGDALIRILDFCAYKGYDIGTVVEEKLEYNSDRADHKRENRQQINGKKY
jgi:NTP pyrophosphatase (non-canonical NTP hydrolase)